MERAYRGEPLSEWEKGLAWALERWPIPFEAFLHMREGFQTDLGPVRLKTEEELLRYCYQVAGTVGRMMAPIAGGEKAAEKAVKLGQAMQLTNILRDVGEDLRRDRVYLPLDLLRAHGVRVEDLRAGRISPGYRSLMAYLEGKARALYREGLSGLEHLRVGRAAIALAALQYQGILDKLRLQGYDNLHRRAHLKPWERLWLIPKALLAARARRGSYPRPMVLVWHRADLRLSDHPALLQALSQGPVVGLVVLDPHNLRTSPRRRAWFLENVRALREAYRARGGAFGCWRAFPGKRCRRRRRGSGPRRSTP